jgi:hypothetical protein
MPLFFDHNDARTLCDQLENVRLCIRRARRLTTKFESASGQACNKDLSEAEEELGRALKKLR